LNIALEEDRGGNLNTGGLALCFHLVINFKDAFLAAHRKQARLTQLHQGLLRQTQVQPKRIYLAWLYFPFNARYQLSGDPTLPNTEGGRALEPKHPGRHH
jgi:hypothetical protein